MPNCLFTPFSPKHFDLMYIFEVPKLISEVILIRNLKTNPQWWGGERGSKLKNFLGHIMMTYLGDS